MRVDRTSYPEAVAQILGWARRGESRYVCCAAVNNAVLSSESPEYRRVMNEADLVTPDGMPLVWWLRLSGHREATRVYGPDLTLHLLAAAAQERLPVGFYGSDCGTLERLAATATARFPGLWIAYTYAPPFRDLTPEEDALVCEQIRSSGTRLLFVGLGAPKQERWMAAHRSRIPAVMIGVGAAFDFLAGTKPQAPRWMQRAGLEWLFRLVTEPRRLGPRYLRQNPKFLALLALEGLGLRPRT